MKLHSVLPIFCHFRYLPPQNMTKPQLPRTYLVLDIRSTLLHLFRCPNAAFSNLHEDTTFSKEVDGTTNKIIMTCHQKMPRWTIKNWATIFWTWLWNHNCFSVKTTYHLENLVNMFEGRNPTFWFLSRSKISDIMQGSADGWPGLASQIKMDCGAMFLENKTNVLSPWVVHHQTLGRIEGEPETSMFCRLGDSRGGICISWMFLQTFQTTEYPIGSKYDIYVHLSPPNVGKYT